MPIMQKRHYELLATVLHLSKPPIMGFDNPQAAKAADDQHKSTVDKFLKMLAVDNPRFDAEQFTDWIEEGGRVKEGRTPKKR